MSGSNFNNTDNKAVSEKGEQDLTNKTVNGVNLESDGLGNQFLADDGSYKLTPGGGGGVQSVEADSGQLDVSVNNTDPANPKISVKGISEAFPEIVLEDYILTTSDYLVIASPVFELSDIKLTLPDITVAINEKYFCDIWNASVNNDFVINIHDSNDNFIQSVSAQERVLAFPVGNSWETRFSSTYPFTDESLSGSGKFSEPLSVLIDGIDESATRLFLTPAERSLIANQSGINTGDETTLTIQTKRPIKTVNGESLEGSGNVTIAGGGVQSVTGEGVGGTAADPVMSFPDADEVSDASTTNKWSSAAEKQSIIDNTAALAVLDTYIEHGRRSPITPDVPLIIDGPADQFEIIDTYTFSVPDADTYKLAVIIAWNLDSPQQKAVFEFELDSTVILEATLEPKDGQNDDFLFVFGLRDLTAGSHTIEAKGTKTNASAVLTIDGCSWTRNRMILDT